MKDQEWYPCENDKSTRITLEICVGRFYKGNSMCRKRDPVYKSRYKCSVAEKLRKGAYGDYGQNGKGL